jgi:hypothetical protein
MEDRPFYLFSGSYVGFYRLSYYQTDAKISTQTQVRRTDLLIPALYPSVPNLVTNDWLQQIIPKLSRMPIAQELSEANAQQGLIVVRLHHSVQHHQQRVTDRCLFRNPSHPPCSVSGIRNRLIQSNESIRISGFTQSCVQASLQASTGTYTTTNQNGSY